MECSLHSLEALGENIDYRHFVEMISEKLPQKVLHQLYMLKSDSEEWTAPKLRQLLEKNITVLEMAGGDSCFVQVPVKPFTKCAQGGMSEQLHSFKPTAGGLLAGTQKALMVQKQNPRCFYCGQIH